MAKKGTNKMEVSKIMMFPSRKVNLGNYNTVELSAGVEILIDPPADIDSKEVKQAFDKARKLTRTELAEQYKPYKKLFTKKKGGEK